MVEQIFLLPHVKQNVIISNNYGIYDLPNELQLRKLGNTRQFSKLYTIIA